MKFSKVITSIGLAVSSVLFVSNSAQAASFTSNVTQNSGTKGDVFLDSITQNGTTFSNFSYVNGANIEYNDDYTGGNSGAISTDHGDKVNMGGISRIEGLNENSLAHEQNVVDYLGNNNLNKIIDTEDKGTFTLDLFFDSLIQEDNKGLDSLFFFERGMNSNMLIQALDVDGNLTGNQLLLRGTKGAAQKTISESYDSEISQQNAGYKINTKEIGGNQEVGSWGVSLADLDVDSLAGVQIYAAGKSYNGPDFTVVARSSSNRDFAQAAKVPEPGTIIGLGSVAALAFMRRRKSK